MKKLFLLFTALSLTATPAMAATDGSFGATSTGTIDVSVTGVEPPAPEVRVSGLSDLDFGQITRNAGGHFTITGDTVSINTICVELNNASTYSIHIESANSGGQQIGRLFGANTGGSNQLQYGWTYTDSAGTAVTSNDGTGLVPGSGLGCEFGGAASLTLSGGSLANSGPAQAFTDTLTLTLAPE